jgi:hypothetical protein
VKPPHQSGATKPRRPLITRNWLVIVFLGTMILTTGALLVGCYLLFLRPLVLTDMDRKTTLVFAVRGDENDRIKALIQDGRIQEVIDFYASYTKDRYNANVILQAALLNGIPVNLWFGLVWQENPDFDPLSIAGPNQNGSYDLGMGQANDNTYADIPRRLLLDVGYNMQTCSTHLASVKEGLDPRTKKRVKPPTSWDVAVVYYNAGQGAESVAMKSVERLSVILSHERELSKAFWSRFSAG